MTSTLSVLLDGFTWHVPVTRHSVGIHVGYGWTDDDPKQRPVPHDVMLLVLAEARRQDAAEANPPRLVRAVWGSVGCERTRTAMVIRGAGYDRTQVSRELVRLERAGKVERVGRGFWRRVGGVG